MSNVQFIVLLGIFLAGTAYVAWMTRRRPDDNDRARVGEFTEKLRQAESKRDELSGKNKELFAAHVKLEAESKTLQKTVASYEAMEKKREEQFTVRLQQLEAAKEALEKERARVQRQDEERLRTEEEERDRVWNDHETAVIAQLRELCRKPETFFPCYDNTNLPAGFDGSLEPDFLIDFLGQYVIFDAKASKAKRLQAYISDAVKKTAEKIKGNEKIARFLYLVVPALAIAELKGRTSYVNGDYTVFVVSPDALAPILASLKRITQYEIAEQLDPQQRENIVSLIAKFDWHISMRNGYDILMAKHGAEIVGDVRSLAPDLVADILDRKEKLGVLTPNKSEIKRLLNPDARLQEIGDMENPKPKILKKAVEAAQSLLK